LAAGLSSTPDVAGNDALADFFKIDENTVYLSPAPLYHAAPLVYNMLVVFRGGTSVIMEKFDAESSLALIGRYRCTHSQWVANHVYPHVEAAGSSSRKMRFKLDALCDSRRSPMPARNQGANDRMVGKHHLGVLQFN